MVFKFKQLKLKTWIAFAFLSFLLAGFIVYKFFGVHYLHVKKDITNTPTPTTEIAKNYKGVAIQPVVLQYPENEKNSEPFLLGMTDNFDIVFLNYVTKTIYVYHDGQLILKENLGADARIKDIQMAKLYTTDNDTNSKIVILTQDSKIWIYQLTSNGEKASLVFDKVVKVLDQAIYLQKDLLAADNAWVVSINPNLYGLPEAGVDEDTHNTDNKTNQNYEVGEFEGINKVDWFNKLTLLNINNYKTHPVNIQIDYVPLGQLDKDMELILPFSPMSLKELAVFYKMNNKFNLQKFPCDEEDYIADMFFKYTNLLILRSDKCLTTSAIEQMQAAYNNSTPSEEQHELSQTHNDEYKLAQVFFDIQNKKFKIRLVNSSYLGKIIDIFNPDKNLANDQNMFDYYAVFAINQNLYFVDAKNARLIRFNNYYDSVDDKNIVITQLDFLKDVFMQGIEVINVNNQKGYADILINESILVRIYDKITT